MRSLASILFPLSLAILPTTSICRTSTPTPPALTHLATINITTSSPLPIGALTSGDRRVIPITGGHVSGPALNGTVAPLGVDWFLSDTDTNEYIVDGKFVIQTDDGVNVIFHDWGHVPSAHAEFEVGMGTAYEWLNKVVAVVTIGQLDVGARLDVWQVGELLKSH
ncbi:hypothetical protein DL546_007044 [Coniochaeta pulveracea]|uniref:Uncharacterized protein n=1 Tax=Coniochaeta pulveracea TaxID=177199 RepID=A0A420YER7_9PEZI|nr:hypothetical protein DL546_007044 [Coniochaeta pulveracea]